MIGLGTASLKIYVALEPQDMRKSFNGLSELALVHLGGRLERDALFAFTNRRRTRIKLLYFDGNGLWVARNAISGPASRTSAASSSRRAARIRPPSGEY